MLLYLRRYGFKSDMWSIGVVAYILLCGYPPFYSEDEASDVEMYKVRGTLYARSRSRTYTHAHAYTCTHAHTRARTHVHIRTQTTSLQAILSCQA